MTIPVNDANTNIIDGSVADASLPFAVHLLDVGGEQYGDAVLCQFGGATVLFDGAHRKNYEKYASHPSIPSQLGELLGLPGPTYTVDLLIVTHLHEDHIGCLPDLVQRDWLRAQWVLAVDPVFRWGDGADADTEDTSIDPDIRRVVSALNEEPRFDADDDVLMDLMADSGGLYQRYTDMLAKLAERGATIVRYGTSKESEVEALKTYFDENRDVSLEILGPRKSDLKICEEYIKNWSGDMLDRLAASNQADSATGPLDLYRQIISEQEASDKPRSAGSFINLESLVVSFTYKNKSFLFTGDMQMAQPETDDPDLVEGKNILLSKIEQHAPYEFVKLSHHGSWNGLSEEVLEKLKSTKLFGLCTGSGSLHHPAPGTLELLKKHGLKWVRTDRNGRITISFGGPTPSIDLSYGKINDPTPPTGTQHDALSPIKGDVSLLQDSPAAVLRYSSDDKNEITLRVPDRARRVTIAIELERKG